MYAPQQNIMRATDKARWFMLNQLLDRIRCISSGKPTGSNGFDTRGALRNRSGKLELSYPVINMKGIPSSDNSSVRG
jgi:hypothetical protein